MKVAMKIRVVGGPVEGKVEIETAASANFATIMVLIESAIQKGTLHDKYNLHRCEVVEKKAKAGAVLSPTDTPESVQLPLTGAIVMLKSMAGSPASTPRESSAAKTPRQLTYRERMVALYEAYDPSKVGSVDATLEKYKGKEEAVIKKLVEKYGPEPSSQSAAEEAPKNATVTPRPTVNPLSWRERMEAMYKMYDPAKIGTVDATLEKFRGKEEAVMKKLVEKYGPEPTQATADPQPPKAETPTPPVSHRDSVANSSPKNTLQNTASAASASYAERITAIYEAYDPEKVNTVASTLEKFKGKEEAVIRKLVEKYGPEPVPAARSRSTSQAASSPPRTRAPTVRIIEPHQSDSSASAVQSESASHPPPPEPLRSPDPPATERSEADPAPEKELGSKDGSITNPAQDPPSQARLEISSDVPLTTPPIAAENVEAPTQIEEAGDPTRLQQATTESNLVQRSFANADARFSQLVGIILRRQWEEATNVKLRHRFRIWVQHTLEQKAEKLLAKGVWVQLEDGTFECQDSLPPFRTNSLVGFLREEGTTQTQVLSDGLNDVLRSLLRLTHRFYDGDLEYFTTTRDGMIIPIRFRDDRETAEMLQKSAVTAMETACSMRKELELLRVSSKEDSSELTILRSQSRNMSLRLAVAEPEAAKAIEIGSQLGECRRELELLRKKCARLEDDLKHVNGDLAKTQHELNMERQGLPTEMEVVIRQKDARLATMERELAKMRLKLRKFCDVEVAYIDRIRELESDVELLERTRHLVPTQRKQQSSPMLPGTGNHSSSPKSAVPSSPILKLYGPKSPSHQSPAPAAHSDPCDTGRSLTPLLSSRYGLTVATRTSPPQVPKLQTNLIQLRIQQRASQPSESNSGEDFEPNVTARLSSISDLAPASSPRNSLESKELVRKSEQLERELSEPVTSTDYGPCPHCHTPMTTIRSGSSAGNTHDQKCCFCFSCRKAFTQLQLQDHEASRARQLRNTRNSRR